MNLGAQWTAPLGAMEDTTWFVRGDLSWKDKQYLDVSNVVWIKARSLVNFRAGIGKGPLIASGMLAVAVAGGAAFTVMRGKQEAKPDDFAKLAPAAPTTSAGAPAAADSVLFSEHSDEAAAPATAAAPSDLFDEAPAAAPAATTAPGAKAPAAAVAAAPALSIEDAVRNGDPVALHDRALELLQSGEKAKAVGMLKDAAGRGLVMAEYRLAKLYEKGEGVPRDMAASRSWTEKAAIGGNVKAMHDLAVFYAEGDAGPQSYAAAVEWFRQASDAGLVDSQYNLAVLYEQGLGLSQDKAEAAYWFEVAGRAGDQDAARRAWRINDEEGYDSDGSEWTTKFQAFLEQPGVAKVKVGPVGVNIQAPGGGVNVMPGGVVSVQGLIVKLG